MNKMQEDYEQNEYDDELNDNSYGEGAHLATEDTGIAYHQPSMYGGYPSPMMYPGMGGVSP